VTYFLVLLRVLAQSFLTSVLIVCDGQSASRAKSDLFAYISLVNCALFVFIVARVASKAPIAFNKGNSIARENARGASHAVATRLVAGVRNVRFP